MNIKSKLNKIRQIKNKISLIKELGGKCELCEEDNFIKLCFHHRDGHDKEFQISSKSKLSYNTLIEEAKKCQVLCQNCHRELHYQNEPKYKNSRRIDKKIYLEYAGNVCKSCGYNKCPAALTFHHIDPSEKKFWIGGLSERMNSIYELSEIIKNEINKCELLCSNCHVLCHFDIDFYNDNKDIIENYKIKNISKKVDRQKVFDLYDSGYKNKDIALIMNCGRSTISDILKVKKVDNK